MRFAVHTRPSTRRELLVLAFGSVLVPAAFVLLAASAWRARMTPRGVVEK